MSKSIVVDRVKVIAEMARQNLTVEELAQKDGVGRSAVIKMRHGQPVWRTTAGRSPPSSALFLMMFSVTPVLFIS